MTIDALKNSVTQVLALPACSAEFFLVLKKDGVRTIKRADMANEVQGELGNQFIATLRAQVTEREDVSLMDLTSADDRANVIYKYDLDPLPDQLTSMASIMANEIKTTFNFATDSLSDIEAIVILIGTQAKQIAIYKHHYAITVIQKKSGFSLIRTKNSNRFEKLDEDILKISSKFEFFYIDGNCYVLDVPTLTRLYGFEKSIKNAATKAIELITISTLIVDAGVLSERLNDLTFCRKLARLTKNSPVLGVVPNTVIIQFVSTHPKLSGSLTLNKNGTQFLLKTKMSQVIFLKVLNDDYLKSLLTQLNYDALAKDSLIEAALTPQIK